MADAAYLDRLWTLVRVAVIGFFCLVTTAEFAWAETGLASWYGPGFHGRRTASGERFNQNGATCSMPGFRAGHRPYAVHVTNLGNGRSAVCRVNDRMANNGRRIDVSKGIAVRLGMIHGGTARVRIERMN